MNELAGSKAAFAPTILRVALGLVFLAHSYAKLAVYTIPGTVSYFEAHGIPGWLVYPVLAIELLGGASLVAGFHTRLAALVLLPVVAGALTPHLPNGWMFTNSGGGWEYVAFLLVALVTQLILGGGELAVTRDTAPKLAVRP